MKLYMEKTVKMKDTVEDYSVISNPMSTSTHSEGINLTTELRPVESFSTTMSTVTYYQRLKEEDALKYLDKVKFKFGDQPQVYNDFLDIMKEFKLESIDTLGVIDRVSSLFNGHPELIDGFNMFLPPGYKIKVKTNEQGYSFQVQLPMSSQSTETTTLVPAKQAPHHLPLPQLPAATTPIVTRKPLNLKTIKVKHCSIPVTVIDTPCSQVVHIAPTSISHSQVLNHDDSPQPVVPQSQPVQFNYAINYVNKIRNRFQAQPDKYKKFLEILHTYKKERCNLKENNEGESSGRAKQLTEVEVYSLVAKLFEHQEDLLTEFAQFLPDALNQVQLTHQNDEEVPLIKHKPVKKDRTTSHLNTKPSTNENASSVSTSGRASPKICEVVHIPSPVIPVPLKETKSLQGIKRSSFLTALSSHNPPAKKHKLSSNLRDISFDEAAKYGTLTDFAFFDKVHKAMHSQDVYDNFLRCINLYTLEVISSAELLQLVTPFFNRIPDLFRWFKEYIGYSDSLSVKLTTSTYHTPSSSLTYIKRPDRLNLDTSDIDFASCKRLGASYCALPKNYEEERCSGRTVLCNEVLNNTWISFPTWSEESTFVTSRKTQYEEYIYRCEDERFELDIVLEVNAATIRVLEGVYKKLCRLPPDKVAKFKLDDCLGGSSSTVHRRALLRVYGDKGQEIIEGLKKNPVVAVPIILKRLKAKDEEWRQAQIGFNKIWRKQNEKYYLKSLDYQGIHFKQNDMKYIRPNSLLHEIETCYDKRHEQVEKTKDPSVILGPHLSLQYKNKSVLDDAANLLIHHVKRQSGIHKEDKACIKQMLRHLLPDLFHHSQQELSEDERETEGVKSVKESPNKNESKSDDMSKDNDNKGDMEEAYTLFFCNVNWYLFFRLHQILCDRLAYMCEKTKILACDDAKYKTLRSEAAAAALRLKPKSEYLIDIEIEEYYQTFLDMVKNVLDGNMDANIYEDTLREMFGIHAYLAFTLDKVVISAVRQLQHLVSDETCINCVNMFHKARSCGGTGGPCTFAHSRYQAEATYQHKAETALAKVNCFKIFIYKVDCKCTIELLDTEISYTENQNRDMWSVYVVEDKIK